MKHRHASFFSNRLMRLKAMALRPPGLRTGWGVGAIVALGLSSVATLQAQALDPADGMASLKTVAVPGPTQQEQAVYIRNKKAAVQLGKALFWDMKVGSDNQTACASCHFQAGADNRVINQINPGVLAGDRTFQLGGPNYTFKESDFALTKFLFNNSYRVSDANEVVSSQGVFATVFSAVGAPGAPDVCASVSDAVGDGGFGFHRDGLNTRRVEPRHAPTLINAVFNFRNFWDGRANNVFNGGDPFGQRNPNAFIWKTEHGVLRQVPVAIASSSLASQGSGPPLSEFEMSCGSRAFVSLAQKLLPLQPLSGQQIDPKDSVLGPLAAQRAQKKQDTYQDLIQAAFHPSLWDNKQKIALNPAELRKFGSMDLVKRNKKDLPAQQVNQLEANFSLFFSLALQMYQSTLVSDDTPFDRFAEGNSAALTAQQQRGLTVFKEQGRCLNCHGGAELTNASFRSVMTQRLKRMPLANNLEAVYDNGFYNIGVRPTTEDIGLGGSDPFGYPLSETRMVQSGQAALLGNGFSQASNPSVGANQRVAVEGAFKTPGLRNVELTGPYMHNGGKSTLMQVVDFYDRGGDFAYENRDNLASDIRPLRLSPSQKDDLVAFLLSLTDERVKYRKAPFDHPSICLPNGHAQDAAGKLTADSSDGLGLKSRDAPYRCIAATGAGGADTGLVPFMGLSPYAP
ncbi:MAG: cytochrome-c peroxidase [Pseudomonadota bacterium]|nr:cytochrome-c peroxidase [Pseudomonadota bacterium]